MVELGQVVMTAAVAAKVEQDPDRMLLVEHCLARHGKADWGDLDSEDLEMNDRALEGDDRLLSSYACNFGPDDKLWIITEWDRSVTTVLFPSDY